jgi:hypothetical protein
VERWEEQSGFSPSTMAAEIAGLTAASHIARLNGHPVRADIYQATADFSRSIKAWTVTTSGPYAPRYFIRLSQTGDPNAAITYNLGNGSVDADQRAIVDQGFLELVRLGVLPASDPDVQASLKVIDATIEGTTASGPGAGRKAWRTRRGGRRPHGHQTGTATPGARVDAEALGATGGPAGTASTVADSSGNWSLTVPPASAAPRSRSPPRCTAAPGTARST